MTFALFKTRLCIFILSLLQCIFYRPRRTLPLNKITYNGRKGSKLMLPHVIIHLLCVHCNLLFFSATLFWLRPWPLTRLNKVIKWKCETNLKLSEVVIFFFKWFVVIATLTYILMIKKQQSVSVFFFFLLDIVVRFHITFKKTIALM